MSHLSCSGRSGVLCYRYPYNLSFFLFCCLMRSGFNAPLYFRSSSTWMIASFSNKILLSVVKIYSGRFFYRWSFTRFFFSSTKRVFFTVYYDTEFWCNQNFCVTYFLWAEETVLMRCSWWYKVKEKYVCMFFYWSSKSN